MTEMKVEEVKKGSVSVQVSEGVLVSSYQARDL